MQSFPSSRDRPDFETADVFAHKPRDQLFIPLFNSPLDGLITHILAVSPVKALAFVIPKQAPSLFRFPKPPLRLNLQLMICKTRWRIDDDK